MTLLAFHKEYECNMMNLVWWEKTVEYYFVILMIANNQKFLAMPLSGVAESSIGDLVIINDIKFTLIEFKRKKSDIVSEQVKYDDYDRALASLGPESSHHKILYGKQIGNSVKIMVSDYFKESAEEKVLNIQTIFDDGLNHEAFLVYLDELTSFRKKDGRTGGSFNPMDLQNVYGITSSNEVVTWSLHDYCQEFLPDLVPIVTYDNNSTLDLSYD